MTHTPNKNIRQIHFRISQQEYERAQTLSKNLGHPLNDLFKNALFKGPLLAPLLSNDDAKNIMTQLQRMGTNVNQIAKHLNSGLREGFHQELGEIARELTVIRQYVSGVYGHR